VSGTPSDATNSQSWMAGLQWEDVFVGGNSAGVAIGQAPTGEDLEKATMLEVFYKYQVSDNISVTPAVFYASDNQRLVDNSSNWGGVIQTTSDNQRLADNSSNWGGVIQTTFKF